MYTNQHALTCLHFGLLRDFSYLTLDLLIFFPIQLKAEEIVGGKIKKKL